MNHLGNGGGDGGDGAGYGGDGCVGAGYGGDGVAGYSGPVLIMVVLVIDSGYLEHWNSTSTLMSIAKVLMLN